MKVFNKELKLSRNLFLPTIDKNDTRSGYGEGIVIAGDNDENVVVLCGDLTDSTKSRDFATKYPKRFFEVGVAEQNMAGIAAGLGLSGKVPFMASYAVFSPGRNWDQIRVSICFSNANVKIVSSHIGFGTGPDGPSHIALEDIGMLRSLPNITIVSPADFYEAKKAILAMAKIKGPFYIRLGKAKTPVFTTEETPFEIGKAQQLTEGEDVTVIATGQTVYDALMAAKKLKDQNNVSVEVINCSTIKPLDKKVILDSASKTRKVITVEEHQIHGGLGGAVAELLAIELPTQMKILGVKDTFTESGEYEELKYKYGISRDHIERAILDFTK